MTTVLIMLPLAAPLLGACGYALCGWRPATTYLGALSAGGVLAAGIALAVRVAASGPVTGAWGLLRADALSAYMLIVIGAVALVTTAGGVPFLHAEIDTGRATARTARRHNVLVQAFLAAMVAAVLAANLGTLWAAVEATTIATAFLVGQRRTRNAVEAAWKYVLICSVGIALALLGTILLNYASAHTAAPAGLDLTALTANADRLDPGVTRLAVALLVIGFGTKAGLAPLHAWLPDAHSQAPAPVSALMSGVLLAVASYAVLRVKIVADAALGTGFVRWVLLGMALATLAVAASLLLAQRDYKRMLAYSSMEHMALVALGAATGTRLGLTAALLHILGHGLAKATLFLGAGRILQTARSSLVADVRGLGARDPALAGLVGLGVLALLGFPPFSMFASELGIIRAGFETTLTGAATAVALVLVVVISAALVVRTSQMLLGPSPLVGTVRPEGPGAAAAPDRTPAATLVVLSAALTTCAALGVTAGPLHDLLNLAAAVIGGSP